MWRIELLIDEGKLEKVMRQLPTKYVQIAGPFPVSNAAKAAGKVVEAGDPTSGPDLVLFLAAKHVGQQLTRSYIIENAAPYGISTQGAAQAISKALQSGVLRKTKTKGIYNVPKEKK